MDSEQVAVRLMDHEDRLKVVEQGVGNFRKFQRDMDHKIGFVYGATWIGGIVGVALLAVFAWVLTLILPAAKVVVEDYYRNHPGARIEQKTIIEPQPEPYTEAAQTPLSAER